MDPLVLAELGTYSSHVAWAVIATFVLALVLEQVDREYARPVYVLAFVIFAIFWAILVYPFFIEDNSVIRGAGAVIAAPLSLVLAKVLASGRDQLFTVSRAVAFMTLVYTPFLLVPALQEALIAAVAGQTAWLMAAIGYDPNLVHGVGAVRETGAVSNVADTFAFHYDDEIITFTIILACTGIGSMSVVAGLVLAVRAPLRRKAMALGLAIPIIYGLNLIRNVFIGVSFGHQYMDWAPGFIMTLFNVGHPMSVSYIWADRIIAQSASVVAMILIIWLVIRIVPEVMQPIEEVLYLLTGKEYDLAEALDVSTPDRADSA